MGVLGRHVGRGRRRNTADSVGDDMCDRGAQVDHGGLRAHGHIGGDASQGAQVLDDEGAAAQQVWDGAAVQVGHDQGDTCSSSRWCHECHLQHSASTSRFWA